MSNVPGRMFYDSDEAFQSSAAAASLSTQSMVPGPRMTGNDPVGVKPAPAPTNAMSTSEAKKMLDENPAAAGVVLAAELERVEGPRKQVLRAVKAAAQRQEPSDQSIIDQVDAALAAEEA
jgi:hypothetical protein